MLREFFSGQPQSHSSVFPYVTVCNLEQRRINTHHEYSVQVRCSLALEHFQCVDFTVRSLDQYVQREDLLVFVVVARRSHCAQCMQSHQDHLRHITQQSHRCENVLPSFVQSKCVQMQEVGSYFDTDYAPLYRVAKDDDDELNETNRLINERNEELRRHSSAFLIPFTIQKFLPLRQKRVFVRRPSTRPSIQQWVRWSVVITCVARTPRRNSTRRGGRTNRTILKKH